MPQVFEDVWGNDPLVGVKTRDLVFATCHSDPYVLICGGIINPVIIGHVLGCQYSPIRWSLPVLVIGAEGTQNEDEDEESNSQVYKISVWAPRGTASQAAEKWSLHVPGWRFPQMGVPQNGLRGEIPFKWMMTGGTPILGHHHGQLIGSAFGICGCRSCWETSWNMPLFFVPILWVYSMSMIINHEL